MKSAATTIGIRTVSHEPRVRDLMSKEVFTLLEDDSLDILEPLMEWRNIRHVPVVDDARHPVGLVTHRDFLKIAISKLAALSKRETHAIYKNIKIRDIMGKHLKTVGPDTLLCDAAEIMRTHQFGCLPVVEEGRLVGIITEADFVRAFYEWDVKFNGKDL